MKIKTTRYVVVSILLMLISVTGYVCASRLRNNLNETAWMMVNTAALILLLVSIALLIVTAIAVSSRIRKRLFAFKYAWRGITTCLKNEIHFRIHCCAALLVGLMGYFLKLSPLEWAAVIICIAFVLTAELLNSALERLCNMIEPSQHPIIKMIKDMAAGAVLIAASGSVVVALFIFLPKIISFIHSL
ncbi:MAG: diacylglycerol kinase family protein [Bacteroidetes bacterium]|nr:diacylglycerol kinase family protein [Bacteroidota bacterium]